MKPVAGVAICHSSSPTPPSTTGDLVVFMASIAGNGVDAESCARTLAVTVAKKTHAKRATWVGRFIRAVNAHKHTRHHTYASVHTVCSGIAADGGVSK